MRILIVTGGKAKERKISILSSRSIGKSLKKLKHEVEVFDFALGERSLKKIIHDFDLIFPIIHGREGEGGKLQLLLEDLSVKHMGPKSHSCLKGWDKFDFKKFCHKNDISTPQWEKVNRKTLAKIKIKPPFVIKTSDEGSSVDMHLIRNKSQLKSKYIVDLFKRYKYLLIEEFINGVEVTSGIWREKVLPLVEIVPPDGELFDFENKYNGKTQEIPFAPSLSDEMQEKVKAITEKIRVGLQIRHFSRIDYMVRGEEIFALELNTIPGLTPESLLPKAIKASGMTMEQALESIIAE